MDAADHPWHHAERGRFRFGAPQTNRVVQDLAVQVGEIHHVKFRKAEDAHPGRSKVQPGWRTQPPDTDEQDAGVQRPVLSYAPQVEERVVGTCCLRPSLLFTDNPRSDTTRCEVHLYATRPPACRSQASDRPIHARRGGAIRANIKRQTGCIVYWHEDRGVIQFLLHDGRFNPVNGRVFSGPPQVPWPSIT